MEPEHVKGSNGHVDKHPELKADGTPILEGNNKDVSSPFSPSLESDIGGDGPVHNSSAKAQFDGNMSSYTDPIFSPDIASQTPQASTVSAPPGAQNRLQDSSPEPYPEPSPMKSPSAQAMGQPPGYDPNRIPASIFSSKPTNAAEWSTASNESLFSIQMGNNSFSRDYAILFGKSGEFPRPEDWTGSQSYPFGVSGELPRLEEWNSAQAKTNDLSSLPPVMEVQSREESSVLSGELPRAERKDGSRSPKGAPGTSVENHAKEKPVPSQTVNFPDAAVRRPDGRNADTTPSAPCSPHTFTSPPRFSNDSGNSGSSFAFPVLLNDGGKSAGSLKVVPEKPEEPQPQPQVAKEVPNASKTRCCSFFSCWPRCC